MELLGWRLRHLGRRAPSAPPLRLDVAMPEAVGDGAVTAAAESAAPPPSMPAAAEPAPARAVAS
jgi:hypothetical protein